MEQNNNPQWMSDESVKSIDKRKLDFLSKIFAQGQGKSQKEMMALLIPSMKKAKQENLTFTPQEMSLAINAIKKYSNKEEIEQINKILAKTKNN